MKSQADIEALADTKLKESECLLQYGFNDGAYYLAGYAVELILKAKVCRTLNIADFFLFNRPHKEVYRAYKSHDYNQLLLLSGVCIDFERDTNSDPVLKGHWSIIIGWNENVRYLEGKTFSEVELFITSIKEIKKWIKKHL